MIRNVITFGMIWLLLSGLTIPPPDTVTDEAAIVQAVLFYSPTCPHCHYVIENVLVPLKETHQEQLQILGINTAEVVGAQLYESAIVQFGIPDGRIGVPTLLVMDTVLVGSDEIEAQLPQIVVDGLAQGGIGWPAIPGLHEVFPDLPLAVGTAVEPTIAPPLVLAPAAAESGADTAETAVLAALDAADGLADSEEISVGPESAVRPSGFTLAMTVLVGMIGALSVVAWQWRKKRPLVSRPTAVERFIPVFALAGVVIAVYLSYVEVTQVTAVCGPVGECNAVQSSPYARFFGIPIAVLGLFNYVTVLLLWVWHRRSRQPWSGVGLIGLTILGTLFSIYLTILELFVIRAVCLWCLSSAVVTTILMLLVWRLAAANMPTAEGLSPIG